MTQLTLSLIPHDYDGTLIHQRAIDGYVNATAMCKAVGKKFGDYTRTGTTQEFLKELSLVTGIPVTQLVISIQGGNPEYQGSWVHPDVAINLGQWCSPKFAVAVSRWVREWMTGKIPKAKLPYHIERYMANRSEIPHTHFSMLNEMMFGFVGQMEKDGYTLPERMIPGISMGLMFCKWLRTKKGIDTNRLPTYKHRYQDGRVVDAKLYPNSVLADFRAHFHEEWLPKHAIDYFRKRDPKALPYIQKLLPVIKFKQLTDSN
jgi:hypothetical protein